MKLTVKKHMVWKPSQYAPKYDASLKMWFMWINGKWRNAECCLIQFKDPEQMDFAE